MKKLKQFYKVFDLLLIYLTYNFMKKLKQFYTVFDLPLIYMTFNIFMKRANINLKVLMYL